MILVSTQVEMDIEEIKTLLTVKAREAAGHDAGASHIEFIYDTDKGNSASQLTGACVTFRNNKKKA